MARTKYSRRIVAQTLVTKLLSEPLRTSDWSAMAASYLITSKQVDKAEQLVQDMAREIQVQSGHLLASITSAHELSDTLRQQIADSLARQTNARTVTLDTTVDPTLLSGYVVRTPDYELNTTAQHKLRQLMSLEA